MKLKKYEANHTWKGDIRHYVVPGTFDIVPGVTSVLGKTKSLESAIAIEEWRSRVGPEKAAQIATDACDRGTAMHGLIEHDLAPDQVDAEELEQWRQHPTAGSFYESMQHVLEDVSNAMLIEGTVWHPTGFAGSADALACYQGELTVLDWKTASKPKRSDWIQDYFCQVAGYTAALNYLYKADGLHVSRAAVCIALEDAPAQVFVLEREELLKYWYQFKHRIERFHSGDWVEHQLAAMKGCVA